MRLYYAIQSTIFNIFLTFKADLSFLYLCTHDSFSIQYLYDIAFALGLLVWGALAPIDVRKGNHNGTPVVVQQKSIQIHVLGCPRHGCRVGYWSTDDGENQGHRP